MWEGGGDEEDIRDNCHAANSISRQWHTPRRVDLPSSSMQTDRRRRDALCIGNERSVDSYASGGQTRQEFHSLKKKRRKSHTGRQRQDRGKGGKERQSLLTHQTTPPPRPPHTRRRRKKEFFSCYLLFSPNSISFFFFTGRSLLLLLLLDNERVVVVVVVVYFYDWSRRLVRVVLSFSFSFFFFCFNRSIVVIASTPSPLIAWKDVGGPSASSRSTPSPHGEFIFTAIPLTKRHYTHLYVESIIALFNYYHHQSTTNQPTTQPTNHYRGGYLSSLEK